MSPLAPFLAPERDAAYKLGRPLSGGSGLYMIPGVAFVSSTTTTAASGTDVYEPIWVQSPVVCDRLVANVATLSVGNMRLGLYAADSAWQPIGAPLADSGDISTGTTGTKTYTPGTPVYLPRGRYLSVRNHSSTPTLNAINGNPIAGYMASNSGGDPNNNGLTSLTVARAYAAFPTPGTAWTSVTVGSSLTPIYTIYLRLSAP